MSLHARPTLHVHIRWPIGKGLHTRGHLVFDQIGWPKQKSYEWWFLCRCFARHFSLFIRPNKHWSYQKKIFFNKLSAQGYFFFHLRCFRFSDEWIWIQCASGQVSKLDQIMITMKIEYLESRKDAIKKIAGYSDQSARNQKTKERYRKDLHLFRRKSVLHQRAEVRLIRVEEIIHQWYYCWKLIHATENKG